MRRRKEDRSKQEMEKRYRRSEPGVDWESVMASPDDKYFNAIEGNFFEKMYVDPLKADSWSFGVTLLRMVANTRALQRIDFHQLRDQWIYGEWTDALGNTVYTEGSNVKDILGHDDMLKVFSKSTYFSSDNSAPGKPRRGVGR